MVDKKSQKQKAKKFSFETFKKTLHVTIKCFALHKHLKK